MNFRVDNLFTSLELTKYLLDKQISLVRTIRNNRGGVPDEMKEDKDKHIFFLYYLVFTGILYWVPCHVHKNKKSIILLTINSMPMYEKIKKVNLKLYTTTIKAKSE